MKIGQYIKEVKAEVVRVSWPTPRETAMSVALVLVMVVVAGLFFLAIDAVLYRIIALILI